MQDFAHLIAPITLEDFFENYYEKKILLIQRDNNYYYDYLLSINDIDEYVSRQDIEYPSLRLVQNGKELEGSTYLKNIPYGTSVFEGIVDNDALFKFFNQGATIVVQGLDRSNHRLGNLCRNISKDIPFTFQTNTYLTPKNSQGFSPHYDTHDVFCLQVSGSKKWKLYDSTIKLPSARQPYHAANIDPNTLIVNFEVELMAGDLLYIPRGIIHSAETAENTSLHITMGVFPQRWESFANFLVNKIYSIQSMRETLPLNLSGKNYDYNQIENLFTNRLLACLTPEFISKSIKLFEIEQIQKRKYSSGRRLIDSIELDNISMNTLLTKRKDIVYSFDTTEEYANLIFYNKIIKFPAELEKVLVYIFKSECFAISDLPQLLDDKGKLVLVKKLVKEGFLKVFDHE